MTDTSTQTEYGYATLDVSDVIEVTGTAGQLTAGALFIDYVVSNRGNPALQGTFHPAEEFIRHSLPHAQAIERAGKVMGAISMLNDVLDIANNGINVQNGANFVVDLAGVLNDASMLGRFGGPLLSAFTTGYAIGQFLDHLLGVSDWVGSLAARGDATVNMELSSVVESLARRGDQQCVRLKERYELYAQYENHGARLLNRSGGDAATENPAVLRQRGYEDIGQQRFRELQTNAMWAAQPSLFPGIADITAENNDRALWRQVRDELPRPTDLHGRIERDEAVLEERIAEIRDLQARERAIWATLEDDRGSSSRRPASRSTSRSTSASTNTWGMTTPGGPFQ